MPEFFKNGPVAPTLYPAPDPASPFWKTAPAIGGANPDQQRAMAAELVRTGGLTAEKANEMLTAQGTEPTPADTRGDEAKAFDASFAAAPPEAYKLDYVTGGLIPRGTQPTTVVELNSLAQAWLSETGMPANVGPSIIEAAMASGQRGDLMTASERILWAAGQKVIFDRIAKTPERAAELRAYAANVLASATKNAAFTAALKKGMALQDATVLMNLALHGERVAARSKMK